MFIEALDQLRCPREHEDSWLVAKFLEMRDRDLWSGELGCPVCEARYAVRDGVVLFESSVAPVTSLDPPGEAEVIATAAMLDLSAPKKKIVLRGRWMRFAGALAQSFDARIFINDANPIHPASEQILHIACESAVPLAPESCDAVALSDPDDENLVHSAVKALRLGGRLIAAGSLSVPASVAILAEDQAVWVAEKTGEVTPLRRGSR
jgi:uncharacterized protein YbaR (Trm112 family)